MATAADLIARRLHEAGCRYAFGIPGGEVLTMMDALAAEGIRFVLVKHENAGGFMAEGTHHVTGAPGILLATIGPGVANAVNVVANAWQDRVPLIFITGCVDEAEAATYTHQVFDHQQLLRPVVKASLKVPHGAVAATIDKALAIALDGQPGPVHLDLPIAVAAAEQPDGPAMRRPAPSHSAPAKGPDLDRARQWLEEARRPIILAGVDAMNGAAGPALTETAHRLGAPVIASYKAKGLIDEGDPLSLGGAGLSPVADAVLKPFLAESDCILLAGYDPIEMRTGWRDPWPEGARVIELAAVPNSHYMHRAALSFVGDIEAGMAAITLGVEPAGRWPAGRLEDARGQLRAAFRVDEEWGPAAIVDTVRRHLPADGIATCDSGAHRILLSQVWRCHQPRGLLQSTGLCTMGCALPLGIGAQLAAPGRPVVAFSGDAGLEMALGELSTLRDLKLPLTIIVFVDASLALIELKQRRDQRPNIGVDFDETDFPAVARAYGGDGHWAESRAELESALGEALAPGRDRFSLIACRIPRQSYDGRI